MSKAFSEVFHELSANHESSLGEPKASLVKFAIYDADGNVIVEDKF